ncbi:amidase signature domain-containing protein [Hypoxylon cercidicola]|nr:amidase signature domain-containing protein [Hypoxylon cercidicola]
MKATFGLSFLSLAAALDFQWSYEGQQYWATEVNRIDKSDDTLGLSSHIGHEGLGYFKVGNVDWPQFCRSVTSDEYEPGAYVVASISGQLVIAKAYNVMPDPAQAFMTGVVPACNDSYKPFSGNGIPVPPAAGGDGPLAGLRFAVKDLYHVKGIETFAGSRAYGASYPPQNHTSGMVRKTLAGGATMVGKVKTTQFALTTTRNGWEVDFHDPFNSRGDGYLSTAGSSSGPGSAMVAYDWLDFAIGSDTGGSVRYPANHGGIFGYRPSQNYYDLAGVVPCVLSLDTPGFFARSPEVFKKVFDVWSAGTELALDKVALPSKLMYWAEQVPLEQEEAQNMLTGFFSKIESTFNMTSVTTNLTEVWMENAVNQSLNDYYNTVYGDMNSRESWDLIGVPLFQAYGELTAGAAPPVDPATNITWTSGQNETIRVRYDEALRRGQQFREFYSEHVMPHNADTCTDSIIAFTYHGDTPENRVDLVPFATTGGWYSALPGSYAGAPEIIVPIGQVPYWSKFTLRTEYRPLSAAFQAARGCDAVLFKFVEEMAKAGLISEVKTGRLAFPQ